MSRASRTMDLLSLAALAGLVAFTASVYDRLPPQIATQFDLRGRPKAWMSLGYGTWGVDAFALAMWALVRTSPKWLPAANDWRKRAEQSPMAAVAMLTMLLLVGVSAFIVWNGLHPEMPRLATLDVLLGFYALALSSILPRVRRNPILGIRTPFSLTSDENWLRTNRFASYSFGIGGLASIASGVAGAPAVGVVAFVGAAITPWIYSWAIAYRLPPES
jgi:uncharacterized membrane protein